MKYRQWLPIRILEAIGAGLWGCVGVSGYEHILPEADDSPSPEADDSLSMHNCLSCKVPHTMERGYIDGYCLDCRKKGMRWVK